MLNPSKKFIGMETLKNYNPSTAHRRKERVAEKKKNKAERKVTREQTLLKKNPAAIKEELDKLELMVKSGQPLTDGRMRRLQKLQQLWAQVVSSVEAERRVLTADVSSIAATDTRAGPSSSIFTKCLQQRLSHGERIPEEEERRYYCPELCNTGIFRHPDGSIRPYPPLVANNKSEQRRRFVETQQAHFRGRAGSPRESDASSEMESDDEENEAATSGEAAGSSAKPAAGAEHRGGAAEDLLASIPLPSEPPPSDTAPPAAASAAEHQGPTMPFMPFAFPGAPMTAYGGAAAQQAGAAPHGVGAFVPFSGIPAPPPQLLAQMHQSMPMQQQPQRNVTPPLPQQQQQQQQQQQKQRSPMPQQQSAGAAGFNQQRSPRVLPTPSPPPKKQHGGTPAWDSADLKAAIAFVPTHLRTKKLPPTAKAQECPSISRVSAYSMGTAARGRGAGGEGKSGLARFLGEAKKQQGDAASRTQQKAGPADLDKAFDEFLKEVGAA
ncbi:hypothetical protein Esti_004702 [Eimeria stiedai]